MADTKQIMTRAWQIARLGFHRFGGSARMYLAEALRQSWEESRRAEAIPEGCRYDWRPVRGRHYFNPIIGGKPAFHLEKMLAR